MTTSDKSPRRELLEEAADLIDGDRNVSYGSPTQNFQNIADMWTTRFSHMLKDGESFSPSDVADAMILVKVARNIASQKRDNWADIAGYAGCGYEASLVPEPAPEKPVFARGGGHGRGGGGDAYITINTPTSSPGFDAVETGHMVARHLTDQISRSGGQA